MFNKYTKAHLQLFLRIVFGQVLPQLQVLAVYSHNCVSTSDRLNLQQLTDLFDLYEKILTVLHSGDSIRSTLKFYLQGLRFDEKRSLVSCDFGLKQVQFYFKHRTDNLLQPCSSVLTVNYSDALETFFSSRSTKDSVQFFQLYPNLQAVILDRRSFAGRPLEHATNVAPFVAFLRACNRLTKLELFYSNHGIGFHFELAQLASLATLTTLVLFEMPEKFREHVSFTLFLNRFPLLRNFHTNLATKQEILTIIQMMPLNARFQFDFADRTAKSDYYSRCAIWRSSESVYEVIFGRGSIIEGFYRYFVESSRHFFTSLNTLLDWFVRPDLDFNFDHRRSSTWGN